MKKKQRYVKIVLCALFILFACTFVSGAETIDTALPECEEHSYEAVVVPATVEADGYTAKKCNVCMQETEKEIIKKIGTVELDKTVHHFYDSKIYPDLHVWDADGEINPADGYTVKKPSNPRKPGTYNYVVTFFGKYKGTVTLSYTIENPVSTPVLKSISSTSKGVKIVWNEAEGVSYCVVYRKEGTGSWKQIATVKDDCEYVDSTALYGKTYTYTVKGRGYSYGTYVDSAYDKKGLTIKVGSVWTPDAPVVTLKNKQAVIKWNKIAGATQYRIYRSTSKKGEYKLIYTHKKGSLSYVDKKVKAGQNYYYKICAYNGAAASKLSSYTNIYITLQHLCLLKKLRQHLLLLPLDGKL